MDVTLDHLRRSRKTKTDLIQRLDFVKSPIDNRLVNLKRKPTEYSQRLWVDRDRIRGQLLRTKVQLETQQQRLIMDYERDVRHLQDRLLVLLNKHEQLDDSLHGNRENPTET